MIRLPPKPPPLLLTQRLSGAIALVVALMLMLGRAGALMADTVWIEPAAPTSTQSDWYPRAIEIRVGEVLQFDAEQLRMKLQGDGGEMVVAAHRVLWIEPDTLSELEAESRDLFAAGKYSESLTKLPPILAAKPPVWRQQCLTMRAAVAAWKSRRSDIALELVAQLDRRPLPPLAIAWLPIAWTNRPLAANVIDDALARLADPSPAAQLVAASWLLSSSHRSQAVTVLQQLASNPRKEIASFAGILLWRTASPPEVIASAADWEATIDRLPMVWQTGPLTLVLDKLRAANQSDRANRLRWALELTPIHPHVEWMETTPESQP